MNFEYNTHKSNKNREKHGIDFIKAQELWNDPEGVGFPARSDDEPRYALLARIKDKHWVAFYTIIKDKIRIISVRRARRKEREFYES